MTNEGSAISRDIRHTVRYATHTEVYWKDGVACGKDEEWTHVDVRSNIPFAGSIRLSVGVRGILLAMRALLEDAWVIGQSDAKRQVRDALGIKEPR